MVFGEKSFWFLIKMQILKMWATEDEIAAVVTLLRNDKNTIEFLFVAVSNKITK